LVIPVTLPPGRLRLATTPRTYAAAQFVDPTRAIGLIHPFQLFEVVVHVDHHVQP